MRTNGGSAARQRNVGSSPSALRHLGAMHLSGAVLLLTFLVPPFWMIDVGYAVPPNDPTADAPLSLLIAVPLACAGFHVLVQIPAGFLGAWLGKNRTAPVKYGSAVVVAGVLSLLLFCGLGWVAWGGILPAWADAMASRVSWSGRVHVGHADTAHIRAAQTELIARRPILFCGRVPGAGCHSTAAARIPPGSRMIPKPAQAVSHLLGLTALSAVTAFQRR